MILAVAAAGLAPARGDVIVQTRQFTNKSTDFTDSTTLVFDQFDNQGGLRKLNSVTLLYEQALRSTITIANPPAGTTITVNVGTAANPPTLSTATPFGLAIPPAFTETAVVTTLAPITVTRTNGQGDYQQTFSESTTRSFSFNNTAKKAMFTGSGTFGLTAVGQASSSWNSNTGNGSAIIQTKGDVKVTVTYDYSIVPEPTGLALAGSGGGALGLVLLLRRRRDARRAR